MMRARELCATDMAQQDRAKVIAKTTTFNFLAVPVFMKAVLLQNYCSSGARQAATPKLGPKLYHTHLSWSSIALSARMLCIGYNQWFASKRYFLTSMLRYFTAAESHGETLVAFLSGIPAGLDIDLQFIDRELWRRQQGFGRGGRMKIEKDHAHIVSGVRHGKSIGSPIAILLANNDWKNWQDSLPVEGGDPEKHKRVASPRPGHADLAGALKYSFAEARYVLERASA